MDRGKVTGMVVLYKAEDVNGHVLRLAVDCVEDWFTEGFSIPVDDFIDRLCDDYLNAEGYDIEQYDSPAVRKIMREARQAKREMA